MATSIFSDKRLKIFFALWWLLCIALQFIILRQWGVGISFALWDAILSNVVLGAICFLLSYNMKFYLPGKEKYWYFIILSLVACLLWLVLVQAILHLILTGDEGYLRFFNKFWGIRFASGFLLLSSLSMFSMLWYSQQEQKENEARKAESEKLNREAELYRLRQQLQPHFLFNSLNSISALTTGQPEKARHMIQQLSEFLRGTLKKDDQHLTTLAEELQHLKLYLDIEKVRFGHRLHTELDFAEEMMQFSLPALILQPIVENAIKFGLYDTTGEVLIRLTGTVEDQSLKIKVQNPFDSETSPPLKGTGFGLSSIRRRLYLLYGRNDLLETRTADTIFNTVLKIPQTV